MAPAIGGNVKVRKEEEAEKGWGRPDQIRNWKNPCRKVLSIYTPGHHDRTRSEPDRQPKTTSGPTADQDRSCPQESEQIL
ncbi:hypothetical protein TIFTF001_034329 [Ficus carica]|uniref:Uncharacterized protein n=1 Tax=Ficus carica TaxID=3494 RepID=A0AA88DZQ9_FICCA|nr:hypothetical protein TIFTF001_034329 [Ficus carica]